ncbi:hypothetical protein [Aquimarina brevivitae]|uniref:Lipoprotein n=1 Tax=Aquimarina brevivitae TaxID=323412 RepID=A0A4Q7NUT6_9FLAO|nr:hypothetical protein [Aquimarina brevivitae]RZS90618.1 hypothetical protein EV197_3146 [Aquimarina brevivitae]
MKKIIIGLLIVVSSLLIQGCASFPKNRSNPYILNEKRLNVLNGVYKAIHSEADTIGKIHWSYISFFNEIDRKIFNPSIKLDTLKKYTFELEVLNTKRIKICYLENDDKIGEEVIKGKVKNDGYFYLKNKNVKFFGIPYLAGALHINKTRLSKADNGDLVFDLVHHRSGAVLLIMFLGGSNWNYRNIYERIN